MVKRAKLIALAVYVLGWTVVVVRAWIKWGPERAGTALLVGVMLLVVVWRLWSGIRYILFGGKAPRVAIGQNTQFPMARPRKD